MDGTKAAWHPLVVSDDMLELLEFMIDQYPDTQTSKLLKVNPEIMELRQDTHKMGCDMFTGARANERTLAIFQFFDPNADGTISKCEWLLLDQLWNGPTLSLQEFV